MATATTTPKQKAYRTTLITLVHVAKRDMALDEDTYRAILMAQGGGDSLSAMPIDNINKVLTYMKAQGFKLRKSKTDRKQADSTDAKKMRALWLFLHELGAVDDPSEAALLAYVRRIGKVDSLEWLKGRKVDAVIESQKKWAMRFLPAAVEALKAETLQRRAKGLLSPVQLGSAEHAFKRLAAGEGFDIQWEAWQNLRHAVGRSYPA
ncbi:gp16 family protein [Comamonas koreensis]|uniref:Regulatory protein GemA n=1 Tax=Comamonas koreensis TaxID=160825 RepID=A0AAW4XTF4_9BURK|nr:regulatory protein GemA [Comamonas koreensis]MCD2164687.1 regulatory protein GemA [Comamonas koreensis]